MTSVSEKLANRLLTELGIKGTPQRCYGNPANGSTSWECKDTASGKVNRFFDSMSVCLTSPKLEKQHTGNFNYINAEQ